MNGGTVQFDAKTMIDEVLDRYSENRFAVCMQSGRSYTYGDIKLWVDEMSAIFTSEMPQKPSVALLAQNSVAYLVTCLVILRQSQSVFLFSPDWPESTIRAHLDSLGVNHLICETDCMIDQPEEDVRPLTDALEIRQHVRPSDAGVADALIRDRAVPNIHVATSGTTGLNKWVPKDLVAIRQNLGAWADRIGLTQEDQVHSMLPLCTANGVYITFLMPFFRGAAVAVDARFSMSTLRQCFENMIAFESSIMSTVPTILYTANILLDDVFAAEFLNRAKIRFAICGTAPLSSEEKRLFASRMNTPVLFNFGTTETLFVASQCLADWESDDCGELLDGMSASILLDGQLSVSSEIPFQPYWNHDHGGFTPDGDYLTGDLGELKDGRLRITGRKTDMVIVGGFNVHPTEIDRLVVNGSDVLECYTFGVPNAITGEELVTALVLKPDGNAKQAVKNLRKTLELQLPAFKIPRFEVVDAVAKTPTGKPIKSKMVQAISAIRSQ
ncbi:MAG: acyl--CoA ligase [Proteobacteria bacterium]|nr:acyl--CoA ligase [Pseudomonadota bacterium]